MATSNANTGLFVWHGPHDEETARTYLVALAASIGGNLVTGTVDVADASATAPETSRSLAVCHNLILVTPAFAGWLADGHSDAVALAFTRFRAQYPMGRTIPVYFPGARIPYWLRIYAGIDATDTTDASTKHTLALIAQRLTSWMHAFKGNA
jgi:hypothetical protein